jgi:3-methyladenine DNA glycosylase AlkC
MMDMGLVYSKEGLVNCDKLRESIDKVEKVSESLAESYKRRWVETGSNARKQLESFSHLKARVVSKNEVKKVGSLNKQIFMKAKVNATARIINRFYKNHNAVKVKAFIAWKGFYKRFRVQSIRQVRSRNLLKSCFQSLKRNYEIRRNLRSKLEDKLSQGGLPFLKHTTKRPDLARFHREEGRFAMARVYSEWSIKSRGLIGWGLSICNIANS